MPAPCRRRVGVRRVWWGLGYNMHCKSGGYGRLPCWAAVAFPPPFPPPHATPSPSPRRPRSAPFPPPLSVAFAYPLGLIADSALIRPFTPLLLSAPCLAMGNVTEKRGALPRCAADSFGLPVRISQGLNPERKSTPIASLPMERERIATRPPIAENWLPANSPQKIPPPRYYPPLLAWAFPLRLLGNVAKNSCSRAWAICLAVFKRTYELFSDI